MDRLATRSSSEAEPGIKEMFSNELAEDDAIDQVDENKNHKSQADKVSEEINCNMCAEIIPNFTQLLPWN